MRLSNLTIKLVATLGLVLGTSSYGFSQTTETEPNDTCETAQDIGSIAVTGPFTVSGSLDTPPDQPDVDFFRFEATPDAVVVADLEGEPTGAGTLADPFMGLFDSDCNLLASNDDFGGFNSRLQFAVPVDGIFVLAATSFLDDDFTGDGDSSGSYQLTVAPPPPPIGSIAGRVVNGDTGEPVPAALVNVFVCFVSPDFIECNSVNIQDTDSDGRFRFDQDFAGFPLPAGTFEIQVFAEGFEEGFTGLFDVGEGEDFDVGDIPLARLPFFFSDIQACDELLPQGGTCAYSFRLNNSTGGPLRGLAWSLVDGFDLGSRLGFTSFEASTRRGVPIAVRQRVSVAPRSDQLLTFQFDVPSFAPDGATFCTRGSLGVNPDPLINTFLESSLFCITKGDAGFELMSESQSQKIFRTLRGRSQMLREAPSSKAR